HVAPAEADIGVMTFGFSQITHASNKSQRFLKIAEAKGAFDAVAIIAQFPIRSLRSKTLCFLMRERCGAAATRGAFLFGKGFGHFRSSVPVRATFGLKPRFRSPNPPPNHRRAHSEKPPQSRVARRCR